MELTRLSRNLLSDVSVEELEQRLEMALLAVPVSSAEDIGACIYCNQCTECNNIVV
jgi:hypothetical protein